MNLSVSLENDLSVLGCECGETVTQGNSFAVFQKYCAYCSSFKLNFLKVNLMGNVCALSSSSQFLISHKS